MFGFPLQFLDPNKGRRLESSTGRVASRDVIQFAPMKDVHGMCFGRLYIMKFQLWIMCLGSKSFRLILPSVYCLLFP